MEYYAAASKDENNFEYVSSHWAREDVGVPEEAILPFLKGWGLARQAEGYTVTITDENDVEIPLL